MKKEKSAQGNRPFSPIRFCLKWGGLLVLNLALVVLLPPLFFYTISAPPTFENLQAMPYFEGCTVRNVAGRGESPGGREYGGFVPGWVSWVLYENGAGETRAVRLGWDLLFPRYRIESNRDFPIPAGEPTYVLSAPTGFFPTEKVAEKITVRQGNRITQLSLPYAGIPLLYRYRVPYLAAIIALLAAEWALGALFRKLRHLPRRPAAA